MLCSTPSCRTEDRKGGCREAQEGPLRRCCLRHHEETVLSLAGVLRAALPGPLQVCAPRQGPSIELLGVHVCALVLKKAVVMVTDTLPLGGVFTRLLLGPGGGSETDWDLDKLRLGNYQLDNTPPLWAGSSGPHKGLCMMQF